jgi:hypothetical protein
LKRVLIVCLCLANLLIMIDVSLTLMRPSSLQALSLPFGVNTVEGITQGNVIELNNTDYNSTTTFEKPTFGSIAENVTPRMVIEYGDYAIRTSVYAPSGMPSALPARIITEYADYATTLALAPYLGPSPYISDTIPPEIAVTREPSGPQVSEDQNVIVSANIADEQSGVRNATLQYTLDNSTNWSGAYAVPMSLNLTLQPQNSLALSFNATISGQVYGTRVRFRIIAYDFAGNLATKDGVIDTTTYLVVPELPPLVLLPLFAISTLCVATAYRRKHATVE